MSKNMKSYLIVEGQHNGQYIKTNGVPFIKFHHQESVKFIHPPKQYKALPLSVDNYKLTKFYFNESKFIECYRLIGTSDDAATIALFENLLVG